MKVLARQHVVEFYGCVPRWVDSRPRVRAAMRALCRAAALHPVQAVEHPFEPRGLTVLWVLRESHLAYSSWPEHGYAALTISVCGPVARLERALRAFGRSFGASRYRRRLVECRREPTGTRALRGARGERASAGRSS